MLRFCIFCAALLIAAAGQAFADRLTPELGLNGVKSWTHVEDLGSLYGYGLYLKQPVSAKTHLTFEYNYLVNTKRRFGTYTINPFSPNPEMVSGLLKQRNQMRSFSAGFLTLLTHSRSTFLEVGGGLCVAAFSNNANIEKTDYSWRSAWEGRLGLTFEISMLVKDLKDLPLVMRVGFRHRFLTGNITSYQPDGNSCCSSISDDPITTTELSWGFGYQFGR